MGKATSTYLLQESHFERFYDNPFKPSGKGIKYTKWKTVDGRPSGTNRTEVKAFWKSYYDLRDPALLTRIRVQFKGKTIINHEGRVYEKYTQPGSTDTWMRFVEVVDGV